MRFVPGQAGALSHEWCGRAVSYSEARFKETVKELARGGADVILDVVGGECSEPALCATGYGGILELLPEGSRPWR